VSDRRLAAVAGVVAVGLYVALAALSGRVGPLSRAPLLDGLSPQPYRWVNPPPDLGSTNQPPEPSGFSLIVRKGHVPADTLPSSDGQTILIVPEDFVAVPPGTVTIDVKITPLDPATLGTPPDGLTVLGNADRIRATFEPSGTPLRKLVHPFEAILVYPAHVGPPVDRTVITSTDGTTWRAVDSKESPAFRQIEGPVGIGYVAVAGPPSAATSGSRSVWTIAGAIAVAVVLVGAGIVFVLRRRSSA
jgi:hypothetical protein